MDKTKLQTFIQKYHLGGSVPSVKIVADGATLKTNFVSEDKTLAGNVTLNSCDIEKSELGIFNTDKIKNFLKILTDTIKITLNKNDDRLVGLLISDDNTEINFVLSDLSVIPKAPSIKAPKDYDVEIPIDSSFIDLFVKGKNSLPEVDSFTLMMKDGKLVLIIGYAAINSDRVKVNVTPTAGKDKLDKPLSFNANYLKEILLNNSDGTGAVFKVSAIGIANISFTTPDFASNYFLIKKEIES